MRKDQLTCRLCRRYYTMCQDKNSGSHNPGTGRWSLPPSHTSSGLVIVKSLELSMFASLEWGNLSACVTGLQGGLRETGMPCLAVSGTQQGLSQCLLVLHTGYFGGLGTGARQPLAPSLLPSLALAAGQYQRVHHARDSRVSESLPTRPSASQNI